MRQHLMRPLTALVPIALLAAFAAPPLARGAEPLRVTLQSGRVFEAHIDARSDDSHLWLHFSGGTSILLRPVAWGRVTLVERGEEKLTAEEVRERLDDLATPAEELPETAEPVAPLPLGGPTHADLARHALAAPLPLQSLHIDAHVANWDADPEVDGLVVRLLPIDASGKFVPVGGTLEVHLLADRPDPDNRSRYRADFGPRRTRRIGRWVRAVATHDFGPAGGIYRLEFQGIHPEFDPAVSRIGSVHARLSVPGQGTFDATEPDVRIRAYSVVRDLRQLRAGERFFPIERTTPRRP